MPKSSKPSSKSSDEKSPTDPVLADLHWMEKNGALRPARNPSQQQADYDAQAEADREENLNDDYQWAGAD